MDYKISFIVILIFISFLHGYIFSELKIQKNKTIIKPIIPNHLPIKLTKAKEKTIIKKVEKKKKKVIKKPIIEKNTIIKKTLPKTKSKNIIKPTKRKKIINKKKKILKPIKKVISNNVVKKKIKKTEKTNKIKEVTKTATSKNKTQTSNNVNFAKIKNLYLNELRNLVEKNKIYPRSAKRFKQMGKVYITLIIQKDGKLTNIKISKNSKYKRLNSAALKIITDISKFKPIPKKLNKSTLEVTLSIKYEITEGS